MRRRGRCNHLNSSRSNRVPRKARPKPKKPEGRPSKYDPAFAAQATKLCELGATDDDVAAFFSVTPRTIYRWQTQFPEFCQSLKAGKAPADDRVERSLFHRAVGYRHEAVKIFMPAGASAPVYAEYVEQVAPDTTAAIFWLKNRRPDLWRDRVLNEHSGPNGAPIAVQSMPDLSKLTKAQRDALRSILGQAFGGPESDVAAT